MAKKSNLTGTEKKAKRAELKDIAKLRKMSIKDLERRKSFGHEGMRGLRDILQGKHLPESSLGGITKLQERALKSAGKLAEKQFAPLREEAIANFQTQTAPAVASQYAPGSSAMKQALAASSSNLQRGIAADFSSLQSQLAQNMLSQQYQSKIAGLNARLGSGGGLIGQPIQPQFSGLAVAPSYMSKQGDENSFLRKLMAGGSTAAGLGIDIASGGSTMGAGTAAGTAIGQMYLK